MLDFHAGPNRLVILCVFGVFYLADIECLPREFQRNFTLIRDLDKRVQGQYHDDLIGVVCCVSELERKVLSFVLMSVRGTSLNRVGIYGTWG